jgi:FecR protein
MASIYSSLTTRLAVVALFASFALAQHATAQQGTQDQQPSDQPDPEDRNHGVARISLMNGDVSVRRGDSGDFVAAQINAPLLAADSVQTGLASRAEVQFDYANRIRISSSAEVRMGDLRDGAFQVQIARGVATFTVLRDSSAQIEISTPSTSVRPLHRGDYRVAVLEDGTTQITVRSGGAEIYTPQGSQRISLGQTMLVRGSANDPEYQIVAAIGRDEWDAFNERRDRELENSTAYQHVSTDIQGAEDLDTYGRWRQDPTYGQVWTPNVAADWAPYQAGRWVWGDYYGWTWVSTDPWGWAPYHYGNWFYGNAGWSWYPGPYRSRYWYRPAVVGFFGYGAGAGFGFGFGFGNIGWVPLAPYERCNPWWGRGFGRGFTNVNVVNNVNIYNNYRNARGPNGVSSLNAQQFQSGQFGRVSHPTMGQIQNAGLVRGQLPVTPGNGNLRFNDRQTSVTSRNNSRQQFVSRGGFSPPQRTPFEQQRQNMQNSFSSPRGVQQVGGQGQVAQGQGSRFASSPARQSPSSSGSSSWQRFGNPNSSRSAQAPSRSAEPSFGNPNGSRSALPPSRSTEPSVGNPNGSRSAAQSPSRSAEPSSGWGRFGSPAGSNQVQMVRPNSGSTGSYSQFGSQSTPQPRSFSGGGNGYSFEGRSGQGRSVQIAPPIVQQRTQQPSPSGNQGNYRQSTPSYHQFSPAPSSHQSSPAPAPARQSGGGGGGGGQTSSGNSGGRGGHR